MENKEILVPFAQTSIPTVSTDEGIIIENSEKNYLVPTDVVSSTNDSKSYCNWNSLSGSSAESTLSTTSISLTEQNKVLKDIENYHAQKNQQLKDELFERVFDNEQNIFFQENKRFMNSKEKKLLKKEIEKLISKGMIYVNNIGQIISRKGSNYTPAKKSKKKRK